MTMLQQQLQNVFPTLPEEIKDLLLSENFNDGVSKVAQAHGCDEIQTGMLIRLTVRLLSGLIPATQFVSLITEELDISHDESAFIAQEINRDIFNPIKDALKQVHAVGSAPASTVNDATERPIGTAPIVPRPLIKPDLSALPLYSGQAATLQVTASATPSASQPIAPPQIPTQPKVEPKPLPSFSIASALGNIPSTASSQGSATASAMPKAQVGTIAATTSGTEQSGNILEDKLGGTYRMKTETSSSVGTPNTQPAPTQVIPPPPQATTPAPSNQEKSPLAKALDPYREPPV